VSLLLLELNEVNFAYLERYIEQGELPAFARLFAEHGYSQTTSEERHDQLEPWIQWVTAHTGKTLAEHGIFRLGDIDRLGSTEQIWERLERERAICVGAISPMNAENRLKNGGFFVPDPWTNTPATGPFLLRKLGRAISDAVNENAEGRMSVASAFWLVAGALRYARFENYREYLTGALGALRSAWLRAVVLDLLLADTFIAQVRRKRPGFASLFLNGAAHVQHHYMFSSSVYDGPRRNPEWYLQPGQDPLLDVYRAYDRIVGSVRRSFPDYRVMIATGLHQDPHEEITYYWRLRDHAQFLRKVGVPFSNVHARMSRDFLIECRDASDAARAKEILTALRAADGLPVFEVDNRGRDLFAMLTYPREIRAGFELLSGSSSIAGFAEDVVFVALKNGEHNGTGYFIDTGRPKDSSPAVFALAQLPERIAAAFDG
jgi:hypothetical protein